MKRSFVTIIVILLTVGHSFAHYLWIETNSKGKVGQEHEIRVYFGEYTYGVTEKVEGEAYSKVKEFTLWVINASGKKTKLKFEPKDPYYAASFTPKTEGTYTIMLNNDNIDVIDYSKYDFGIFKTHYHAVAKVQVGEKLNETVADNQAGITVKNVPAEAGEIKLQVIYKNEVLPKNEVNVFVADQWSKTLETDENGYVSFNLPWPTKYIVEVTKKEEVPGNYKGVDYEFIWHCVTHYLTK